MSKSSWCYWYYCSRFCHCCCCWYCCKTTTCVTGRSQRRSRGHGLDLFDWRPLCCCCTARIDCRNCRQQARLVALARAHARSLFADRSRAAWASGSRFGAPSSRFSSCPRTPWADRSDAPRWALRGECPWALSPTRSASSSDRLSSSRLIYSCHFKEKEREKRENNLKNKVRGIERFGCCCSLPFYRFESFEWNGWREGRGKLKQLVSWYC